MPERLRTALTWVKAEPRSNPGDDAALAADAFRLLGLQIRRSRHQPPHEFSREPLSMA